MKEKRIEIIGKNVETVLRSGQTMNVDFCGKSLNPLCEHKLFFSCEDTMTASLKDEPFGDKLYMLIDDSLDCENAEKDRYCLSFSCNTPKEYSKRALKKVLWQPLLYGTHNVEGNTSKWSVGVFAKAKNLTFEQGGFLRVRVEKWLTKPDVPPEFTGAVPDETICINISDGTYDYTEFSSSVDIQDNNTACIVVTIEGERYSGEVYFERPFLLSSNNINVLPKFDLAVSGLSEYIWIGYNLSQKEWPKISLQLNGKEFFSGEIFLKVHRYSPVEIKIPEKLINSENNTLTLRYDSNYHDTVPISVKNLSVVEAPLNDFDVVYYPEFVDIGDDLCVLIETKYDDLTLKISGANFIPLSSMKFDDKGLHIVKLKIIHPFGKIGFKLFTDSTEAEIKITSIHKTKDNVLCGSGDMVYIDVSDIEAVKEFLKWYLSNKLGNLITIRPVYRWGGQRTVNNSVWVCFKNICESLGISYVHISDGRDLNGIAQNPPVEVLKGKMFLGRQLHERDGQLFYWPEYPCEIYPTSDDFFDFALSLQREYPDTIEGSYRAENVGMRNGRYSFKRDVNCPADMKAAHDVAAKTLNELSDGYPRHTGPSVMFKYFMQQGFTWLGAETMYGAFEALVAFLRGASKAYGYDKFGVHHAVQWSSYPHDTKQRYNRYLLALYLSYMHGVTDINTEEGFWFFESNYSYLDRFSEPCENHRKAERKFYKYIQSHSRTGTYYTKTAFVHGRYDGWDGFYSQNVWGMPHMPIGDDCASWKLLNVFYPLNKVEKEGMTTEWYIPEDTNAPQGLYSGTPNGNADVIPIENGKFSDYSLLAFAGYNAAEADDFDRLLEYVKQGGTLLFGWPHLSKNTAREDILNNKLDIIPHSFTELICEDISSFKADTFNGKEISVCTAVPKNALVLMVTDGGTPLAYEVSCGEGRIVFVNSTYYPGNEAVYSVYSSLIEKYNKELLEKENAQIICGNDVAYTTYIHENGEKHIYLMPVDWYNAPEKQRKAALKVNEDMYDISLTFGEMIKIVVKDNVAAWFNQENAEIIEIAEDTVKVQGGEAATLYIAKDGKVSEQKIDFNNETVHNISLK